MVIFLPFIAQTSLIQEPQRQMSLAAEIVLILAATLSTPILSAIAWFLFKIWRERIAIYAKVESARREVDDRLEATIAEVDSRFNSGNERFARIEQDLAEVKASMKTNAARTADGNRAIAKIEEKMDRLDERLDAISATVAASAGKVEQVASLMNSTLGDMAGFFSDSHPGRGITARLKKAVREVVRPEALLRPDDTVYPEEADPAYLSTPRNRPPSSPALEPVSSETQEFPALSPIQEKKTNPPRSVNPEATTRPLMRRRPPHETS